MNKNVSQIGCIYYAANESSSARKLEALILFGSDNAELSQDTQER
jgi:hypothetical protein